MPLAFHFKIKRQGNSQSLKAHIGVIFLGLKFYTLTNVRAFVIHRFFTSDTFMARYVFVNFFLQTITMIDAIKNNGKTVHDGNSGITFING